MAKLDWRRTNAEREGFDRHSALEWRHGPAPGSEPSDSDEVSYPQWDSLDPPSIYWASGLVRKFGRDRDAGLDELKVAAGNFALKIYAAGGINLLLSRTLALYGKASRSTPFPTAYFALCFDLAARRVALHPNALHDPPPRKKLSKFYQFDELYSRALICSKLMLDAEGGVKFIANEMKNV